LRIKLISSDAEDALVSALEATINTPNGPLRNAKFRKDFYHLVCQPWQKFIGTCDQSHGDFKRVTKRIYDQIRSWFNYCITKAEFNHSYKCLSKYIQDNEMVTKPTFNCNIQTLLASVLKNIQVVGNHYFMETTTFGFIGSSIVEGTNPGIKRGTFASLPNMSLDRSTLQQLKQATHKALTQNVDYASDMNKFQNWTTSMTSKYLTSYMEGIACKNFDSRTMYHVVYVGNKRWYVMRKQIMDQFKGKTSPSNSEFEHTKYDRVYCVSVDEDGYMTCACGYVQDYLSPCPHCMAVLNEKKFIVPELFHICWSKQFNYYFGSSFGMNNLASLHNNLVECHNVIQKESFDSRGAYRGCNVSGTSFLEGKATEKVNQPEQVYIVMEAIRKYIHFDGPLERGCQKFKKYIVDKHDMPTDYVSDDECNILRDSMSDDEGKQSHISSSCIGSFGNVHSQMSQGSVVLETLLKPQEVNSIEGGDLYNNTVACLATIKTNEQRIEWEEFLRTFSAKNIRENNPSFATNRVNRGTIMFGVDESGPPDSGKRKKARYEM